MRIDRDNLWAPWRMNYIQGVVETTSNKPTGDSDGGGCFLCEAGDVKVPSDEARQRLVLLCDPRGIMLLNRYPYTNGHLMVTPRVHVSDLGDLSPAQRSDLIELTALGDSLLRASINAQGVNVGINIGSCAGAGLPGHLHVHIVPRWHGDTNFMETVGRVRVIPEALDQSYLRFTESLEAIGRG